MSIHSLETVSIRLAVARIKSAADSLNGKQTIEEWDVSRES